MRWASSDVEREHRPTWWRLPADVRGNHHQLVVACSFYENGGAFRSCKGWRDRDWWATAGVHKASLDRLGRFGLVSWTDDGDTLVVHHYDLQHEAKAQASRALGAKLARLRWDAYAARIAARTADRSAEGTADRSADRSAEGSAGRYAPSPSPPDPDLRGDRRSHGPDPHPSGGIPGGTGAGAGSGAPHGAFDGADTGPEGFERWWAMFLKTRPGWRGLALECWVAEDLEGDADEIIAYCHHQAGSRQWRQRGPAGEEYFYVPTPWNLLKKGAWRKKGPWRRPPAPPVAVVDLQHETKALLAYRNLMAVLSDVDLAEDQKEKARRQWLADHPGQSPPWAQQPNHENGRPA